MIKKRLKTIRKTKGKAKESSDTVGKKWTQIYKEHSWGDRRVWNSLDQKTSTSFNYEQIQLICVYDYFR